MAEGFYRLHQIEDALDVTTAEQTELDYLIYNDPLSYADLILERQLEEYSEECDREPWLQD